MVASNFVILPWSSSCRCCSAQYSYIHMNEEELIIKVDASWKRTKSVESANRTRQVVDTISMTGEADVLHNYITVISDQSTNNTCKVIPSCFCHCKVPWAPLTSSLVQCSGRAVQWWCRILLFFHGAVHVAAAAHGIHIFHIANSAVTAAAQANMESGLQTLNIQSTIATAKWTDPAGNQWDRTPCCQCPFKL